LVLSLHHQIFIALSWQPEISSDFGREISRTIRLLRRSK
jgi:hypothetical protein